MTDTNTASSAPLAAPDAPAGLIDPKAQDALAIVSSLGAAGVTAWLYVNRHLYKNLSSLGAFSDMKLSRKQEFDVIKKELKDGAINADGARRKLSELIADNADEFNSRLTRVGIHSFADRWSLLRPHQKFETIVIAAAASSVALGAVLPLVREQMAARVAASSADSQSQAL